MSVRRNQTKIELLQMPGPIKHILIVFLLFQSAWLCGQDFERVDAVIQLYPKQAATTDLLARFINRDFDNDADKLRAIYGWIINNIAYDPQEYKALDYSFTTVSERNKKQDKFRFQLIDRVLDKRVAVCEGYAFLFERLCELTGVTSYLVRGDSKAALGDIGRPFDINHMWNIALVEGEAKLFDSTWGAGKYNGKFVKDPSYRFFMADPKTFIFTHYPQLTDDSLLTDFMDLSTFEQMPLIIGPLLSDFKLLIPQEGILDSNDSSGSWAFSVPVSEQTKLQYSFDGAASKPVLTVWNNQASSHDFELDIPLGAQYLLLYFNDKPGLAYRIK